MNTTQPPPAGGHRMGQAKVESTSPPTGKQLIAAILVKLTQPQRRVAGGDADVHPDVVVGMQSHLGQLLPQLLQTDDKEPQSLRSVLTGVVSGVDAACGASYRWGREVATRTIAELQPVLVSMHRLDALVCSLGKYVSPCVDAGRKQDDDASVEDDEVAIQGSSAAGVLIRRICLWWTLAQFDAQDSLWVTLRLWLEADWGWVAKEFPIVSSMAGVHPVDGRTADAPLAVRPVNQISATLHKDIAAVRRGHQPSQPVPGPGAPDGLTSASAAWLRSKECSGRGDWDGALKECLRYADTCCGSFTRELTNSLRVASGGALLQLAELHSCFGHFDVAADAVRDATVIGQMTAAGELRLAAECAAAGLLLRAGKTIEAAGRLMFALRGAAGVPQLQMLALSALLCVQHPRLVQTIAAELDSHLPLLHDTAYRTTASAVSKPSQQQSVVVGTINSASDTHTGGAQTLPSTASRTYTADVGDARSTNADSNHLCAAAAWAWLPQVRSAEATTGDCAATVLAWRSLWAMNLCLAQTRDSQTSTGCSPEDPQNPEERDHWGHAMVQLLRSQLIDRLGLSHVDAVPTFRGAGFSSARIVLECDNVLRQLRMCGDTSSAIQRMANLIESAPEHVVRRGGVLLQVGSYVFACHCLREGRVPLAEQVVHWALEDEVSALPTVENPIVLWPHFTVLLVRCNMLPPRRDHGAALAAATNAKAKARSSHWCQWSAVFSRCIAECYLAVQSPQLAQAHVDECRHIASAAACRGELAAGEIVALEVDLACGEYASAGRKFAGILQTHGDVLTLQQRARFCSAAASAYAAVAADPTVRLDPGAGGACAAPLPRQSEDGEVQWGVGSTTESAKAAAEWARAALDLSRASCDAFQQVDSMLQLAGVLDTVVSATGTGVAERERAANQAADALETLRVFVSKSAADSVADGLPSLIARAAEECAAS